MVQRIYVQEKVFCVKEKAGDGPGLFLCGYPVVTLTDMRKVAKVSTVVGFVMFESCNIWKAVQTPQMR